MTQSQRDFEGGWVVWAYKQKISPGLSRPYLNNTGATPRGVAKIQEAAKEAYQIQTWAIPVPQTGVLAGRIPVPVTLAPNTTTPLTDQSATTSDTDGLHRQGAKLSSDPHYPGLDQIQQQHVYASITSNPNENISIDGSRESPINDDLSTFAGANFASSKILFKEQLLEWANMTQQQRDLAGGPLEWAQSKNLNPENARKFLRKTGVSRYAATKIYPGGSTPTIEQVNRWVNMSQPERDAAGGVIKWALDQNINVAKALTWLIDKGASASGKARLNDQGTHITTEQLRAWNDMSQQQRFAAGGPLKWAAQQNIRQTSALANLTDTGLQSKTRLKFLDKGEKITTAQIKEWRELTEAQKYEAGGWLPWAEERHIRPSNARHYLTNKGINKLAAARIAHAENMAQSTETDQQTNHAAGTETGAETAGAVVLRE